MEWHQDSYISCFLITWCREYIAQKGMRNSRKLIILFLLFLRKLNYNFSGIGIFNPAFGNRCASPVFNAAGEIWRLLQSTVYYRMYVAKRGPRPSPEGPMTSQMKAHAPPSGIGRWENSKMRSCMQFYLAIISLSGYTNGIERLSLEIHFFPSQYVSAEIISELGDPCNKSNYRRFI